MVKPNKDTKDAEDFKNELREAVNQALEEKEYDRALIRQEIDQALGVGDLDIFLLEFKERFAKSIPKLIPEKRPKGETPAPQEKIEIKELSAYRDPPRRPSRKRKK